MTDVSESADNATPDVRTDNERDAVIRAEWLAGTSITQIGTMVGCSRSSVSRAAQRLHLPARLDLPTRETMPEADLDTIRSEWALGTPVSEIAAKLKCTKGSVLRRVTKLGLTPRPSPIIRDVTPKPRDTDRHRPGYVAPGRVAPSFNRLVQKAPERSFPRASAPAPAPAGPSNEPSPVRVGVPSVPRCQFRLGLSRQCQAIGADEFAVAHVSVAPPNERTILPNGTTEQESDSCELAQNPTAGIRSAGRQDIGERKTCGFPCYTPPKHDEPSHFCNYHHHFRGWP